MSLLSLLHGLLLLLVLLRILEARVNFILQEEQCFSLYNYRLASRLMEAQLGSCSARLSCSKMYEVVKARGQNPPLSIPVGKF